MPREEIYNCDCGDNCGFQLKLLYGEALVTVAVVNTREQKESFVQLSKNSTKRLIKSLSNWVYGESIEVDEELLRAMEKYGGSFARSLAVTYRCADIFNRRKLREIFKDCFEEYRKFV